MGNSLETRVSTPGGKLGKVSDAVTLIPGVDPASKVGGDFSNIC